MQRRGFFASMLGGIGALLLPTEHNPLFRDEDFYLITDAANHQITLGPFDLNTGRLYDDYNSGGITYIVKVSDDKWEIRGQ